MKTPSGIEYEQSFEYYESKYGLNGSFNRTSGAYVFRPKFNYTNNFIVTGTSQVFKGFFINIDDRRKTFAR